MSAQLKISASVVLYTQECCSCGVLFAMPDDMDTRRRRDGGTFYCPVGHPQSYCKSDVDRLKESLDAEKARHQKTLERLNDAQAARDRAAAEARSTHAVLQRVKGKQRATYQKLKQAQRRARAGTCPCCGRTFQQLQRHMASKHPEHVVIGVDPVKKKK